MSQPKDKTSDALARSRLYRLLSMHFLFPDPALLARLQDAGKAADEAAGVLRDRKLRADLGPLASLTLDPVLRRAEYAAAFGHTVAKECPPYETCYGSSHVFMQTHELADIAGFYRAWGLEISDGAKERPDHISVELEFMSYLAFKEAHAAGKGEPEKAALCRKVQAQFLAEHLGRWIPAFSGLLENTAPGAYAALARMVRRMVAWDCERLGAKPVELRSVDLRPVGYDPERDAAACGRAGSCAVGGLPGEVNP